jgi:hypothetical protein
MASNFQNGSNKIKLFTEYEIVTQKVLVHIEPIQYCHIKLFELHFHIP